MGIYEAGEERVTWFGDCGDTFWRVWGRTSAEGFYYPRVDVDVAGSDLVLAVEDSDVADY